MKNGVYIFHQNYVSNPYVLVFMLLFILWSILCFWVYYNFGENWLVITVVVGFILRYFIRVRLEIDTENRRYRSVLNLFGVFIGKWAYFAELSHIQIGGIVEYRIKQNSTDDTYSQAKKIQVRIVCNNADTILAWEGKDKDEAKQAGLFLGENLKTRVLDATKQPFEWINE